MAGQLSSRATRTGAPLLVIVLGVVLAFPALGLADATTPTEKGKTDQRDCQKRAQRPPSGKPCPDGGERLPQDRSRSPLDSLPPLAPLVA